MESLAIIAPELSDFWAIRSNLEMLPDFVFLEAGDKLEDRVGHVILDLSLDLFNLSVTPGYLYNLFAHLQITLASIRLKNIGISVIQSYPCTTDLEHIILAQEIINQFINILVDFFACHIILMPSIVSRYSLKKSYSPVIDIIQAVRMGRSTTVRVDALSRFVLIYDLDVLTALVQYQETMKKGHIVIEGMELSLQNIYDIAQEVAGESPVRFDRSHQIQFHVPNMNAHVINQVNYEFENMMVDMIDRLF